MGGGGSPVHCWEDSQPRRSAATTVGGSCVLWVQSVGWMRLLRLRTRGETGGVLIICNRTHHPNPCTHADPLQQDSYWEQLFMQGSAAAAAAAAAKPEEPPVSGAVGVEVVSFDLDDTLWCGKTVIANANKCVVRNRAGLSGCWSAHQLIDRWACLTFHHRPPSLPIPTTTTTTQGAAGLPGGGAPGAGAGGAAVGGLDDGGAGEAVPGRVFGGP